jgi:hypothetical protein
MKKVLITIFFAANTIVSYACDSVYVYCLPLNTSLSHIVNTKNIALHVSPYVVVDSYKIGQLYSVLDDSSKGIFMDKIANSASCDIRMYVVFFEKNKIKNEFMFKPINGDFLSNKKRYKLNSIKHILEFVISTFSPITESQKHYFKILKAEYNILNYQKSHNDLAVLAQKSRSISSIH